MSSITSAETRQVFIAVIGTMLATLVVLSVAGVVSTPRETIPSNVAYNCVNIPSADGITLYADCTQYKKVDYDYLCQGFVVDERLSSRHCKVE